MAYQGNRNGGYGGYGGRDFAPPAPIKATAIPADYLAQAEDLMQQNYSMISTSKLRRLYSLATEIYNEERLRTEKQLLPDSVAAVAMMRVRIAYEAGRDQKVKTFVEKVRLLEYLKGLDGSREEFMKLTQYMEALVAYHKFFGGKENN